MSTPYTSAAVFGAGSWGTALASLLAENELTTTLVGRNPKTMTQVSKSRINQSYLPHHTLPESLIVTADTSALSTAQIILIVVPTAHYRSTCEELKKVGIPADTVFVSCSKGIERETGERMSQIISDIFPDNPLAVLSGPNHAEEVISQLATCAVIGSENHDLAIQLQTCFSNKRFRCYTQNDVAGIELGGALKNVFAIAAGISAGLGLGDNAASALVTRGLAEMIRLGCVMGGQKETFIGLSGIGDLVATCYSDHSRNNRVGHSIGKGKTRDEAVAELGMVAEGVPNTLSIYEAARRANVRTPLIDSVYAILYENKSATEVLTELLTRDRKHESA